ncbi:MAG: very short patch repair endonuclease [Planctomyces sp.]
MADVHSPEQRSRNMARIRSGDTKPELFVRSLVHRMGARFRLRVKTLPGTPDLVFPGRRKVIFVHGCFWHCHDCRYGQVKPATNAEFWEKKRTQTQERDRRQQQALIDDGWQVLVVWECWTRQPESLLIPELQRFLDLQNSPG